MNQENETDNTVLLKHIYSLGDIGRNELKASLLELLSNEISEAIEHRIMGKKNTPELDGSLRSSLLHKWARIIRFCHVCGDEACFEGEEGRLIEPEHVIERALGGPNSDSNLVPCCHDCNDTLGRVFNTDVLQSRERIGASKPEWEQGIGNWVVFKQLLYCDRDLAFWLFDDFHRQFIEGRCRLGKIVKETPYESGCGLFGLAARKEMGETLEKAFQNLEQRMVERQRETAVEEFESIHGPPPRRSDLSAFARGYRRKKKNYLSEVSA